MPTASSRTNRKREYTPRSDGRSRPFWLPAISYYVLAFAISAACFFIIWGVIFEGGEEAPWITAGIAASIFMIASVFVREVILRNARNKYLADRRRLDRNFSIWTARAAESGKPKKITLRQNERMLDHISKKSEAARIFRDLAEGHREVFAICDDYLSITNSELRRTDVSSPRYLAIRKGRNRVKRLHQYHLLAWTEIESKELLRVAGNADSFEQKVETAGRALLMLESAIQRYPSEDQLLDSAQALREFISAAELGGRLEEAENEESAGNFGEAIIRYERILSQMPEEELGEGEKRLIEERVTGKLSELRSKC